VRWEEGEEGGDVEGVVLVGDGDWEAWGVVLVLVLLFVLVGDWIWGSEKEVGIGLEGVGAGFRADGEEDWGWCVADVAGEGRGVGDFEDSGGGGLGEDVFVDFEAELSGEEGEESEG